MTPVKAEKSCRIVLFDWKDMVHDRTTGDACYQTSNVTMMYKTSIVVLLVMPMHALSFSPGYLNYEADIEAPMATSISFI